jgi:hypothetical protein
MDRQGTYGPGYGEAPLCNMHGYYLKNGVCKGCEMDDALLEAEVGSRYENEIFNLNREIIRLQTSIVNHGRGEWCYDNDCAVCELNYQGTL